ncbi:MAG: cadherin-like beta sandwich domain-containing protein [Peptococcia bacterium]
MKAGFLENLTVSEGQLSSAFDPETFNYTVDVNSTMNSLELTPTLREILHMNY